MARTELWANPHVGQGIDHRTQRWNLLVEAHDGGDRHHRNGSSLNLAASEFPSIAFWAMAASRRAQSSLEKTER